MKDSNSSIDNNCNKDSDESKKQWNNIRNFRRT